MVDPVDKSAVRRREARVLDRDPEVTGMAKAGPPEFERDPVAESKP